MNDVFLQDLAYSLGDESFDVEASAAAGRIRSAAKTLRLAGFERHHVCSPGTSALDLARRSVEPLRDSLPGTSAIVYATCIPANGNVGSVEEFERSRDVKHLMDFPVSRLQAELKLDDAIAIGLNQQACTAMLGSARIARALLGAEPGFERILCVTADRFPESAIYEQSYNLSSDGGAAWVVSREPRGFRLLACHQITNGALSLVSDDESVGMYFNYTHRVIQETLQRAELDISDLAWIVPQNMNVKAWQILARLLKVASERVYFDPLPEVAHVISGDNVINLKRLDESGQLERGDRILLVMAGYGLNWQCVLVEKV